MGAEPVTVRGRVVEATIEQDNLLNAWETVRRGGVSAGIDGLSAEMYGRDFERRVTDLHKRFLRGAYRPSAYRRVLLPKSSGDFRRIAIPTVDDRILQLSLARAIAGAITLRFSDASFAYRSRRGPRRASDFLARILRDARYAVVADIERFFDNVDHDVLIALLRGGGIDPDAVRLVTACLRAPIVDRGCKVQPCKGLPQGSPLSPILANIYLTGFDDALSERHWKHVRYADDFVIAADSEDQAGDQLAFIGDWLLRERKLRIKGEKSGIVQVTSGIEFVGFVHAQGSRAIPASKLEGFCTRVQAILGCTLRDELPKVVRGHNDLVRGWRGFYEGASGEAQRQLATADRWRREQVDAYARAIGLEQELIPLLFQTLVRAEPVAESPLGYAVASESPPRPSLALMDADPWHVTGESLASAAVAFSAPDPPPAATEDASQLPALLTDGVLTVPTHGGYVTYRGGLVSIRRKKATIFECATEEIEQVIFTGRGLLVSSTALLELAARDIAVTVCDGTGFPAGRLSATTARRRPLLVERQVAARASALGGAIAREIVAAKIHNQRAMLLYHAKYSQRATDVRAQLLAAAGTLAEVAREVAAFPAGSAADLRKSIFLCEARAAAHYWGAIGYVVPAPWKFRARHHRGATDPMNSLLNYGYWLLSVRVWHAIERVALDPYLGFLHTSRRGSAGLVFDCMEEFRVPVVDRAVLALIGRGTRVVLRKNGRLSSRTRRRVDRAITKALARRARGARSATLADAIRRQLDRLRDALLEGRRYRGYRMSW